MKELNTAKLLTEKFYSPVAVVTHSPTLGITILFTGRNTNTINGTKSLFYSSEWHKAV